MKLTNVFDGKNVKFMSDLHYNHRGILKFDYPRRQKWKNEGEMNKDFIESLIKETNKDDIIFDLGDLFWKISEQDANEVFKKMKFNKFFKVLGNHDQFGIWKRPTKIQRKVNIISDLLDIQVIYGGVKYLLTLCHYPLISWNHKAQGSFMIHGHCHGNIDEVNELSPDLRVDVGYDASLAKQLNKTLITFEDILKYFTNKAGTTDFKNWTLTNCKNTL